MDAGADQAVTLPNTATLTAAVTDDGLPDPPGTLTLHWTQVSGPQPASFTHPGAAVSGVSFPAPGAYVLRLSAADGELATSDDVSIDVHAEPPPPDLVVSAIDVSAVLVNAQTLDVAGRVRVAVANAGTGPAAASFAVTLYEERDGDARPGAGDNVLATFTVPALAAGETRELDADIAGTLAFAASPLHAYADSAEELPESDEANNHFASLPPCAPLADTAPLSLHREWAWTGAGAATLPDWTRVAMTPVVADLDGDGAPEVVFSSHSGTSFSTGVVRAVRGHDGGEVFTVSDPAQRVVGAAQLAVGDIDGDGRPEIVGVHASFSRLIAFEHDGTLKWTSAQVKPMGWGGLSLADLDGDGRAEIVAGAAVVNGDGTLRFQGLFGEGHGGGSGPYSAVADVNMDGSPDIVTGNTVYNADGSVQWRNAALPDGYTAVANFDTDPFPEIVLVSGDHLYLLEHTGTLKWGPVTIPRPTVVSYRGGPPLVADLDGDGRPDIGVVSVLRFSVFDAFGALRWTAVHTDSSGITTASAFDFEGDGKVEVLHADEQHLRVWSGLDGTLLYQEPLGSITVFEGPLVADVDGDGRAEIVVGGGGHAGTVPGLHVFGDVRNRWVATRRVWNQHTYHVTNVEDDGRIPRHEPNSWETVNSYRQTTLVTGCLYARPDLTASYVRLVRQGGEWHVTARVGNAGNGLAGPGVPVSFYDGDPSADPPRLGTVVTSGALLPGRFEDVTLALPASVTTRASLWVVADDLGGLRGRGTFTRTVYDALGRQLETHDKLGRKTAFEYDPMGRLVKTTYPDGTFEDSTYDGEGRRLTSKDRAGRVTAYEYDAAGRLTKTTYPDDAFTTNTYDALGRRISETDQAGKTTRFGHDPLGQLTAVVDALHQRRRRPGHDRGQGGPPWPPRRPRPSPR